MKIRIFVTLFLVEFFYFSYAFDENTFFPKNLQNKGIKKIIEKTFDQWEVISSFNKEGFLLNEVNFYNKKIKSDYKYDYLVTDTLLEVKKVDINKMENHYVIEKYYYHKSGQCYKFEMYFSKSDTISYFGDNFIYENGILTSYTKGNFWQKKHGTLKKIIFRYNEKQQKIRELNIYKTDTTFYFYNYNQQGKLIDYVKESNDKEEIFSGVFCWSDKILNKVHIKYSNFDKRGNWTKSYFMTEKGKIFRSERKIEYWE